MGQSNAERFLSAYARIERKMSEMRGATSFMPFSSMLSKCAQDDPVIMANQENLREYHELRNSIVHLRGRENEIIAEPVDSVTVDIERIAELLERTGNVMHYASQPVKTVSPSTSIDDAYSLMEKLNTAKIPVYENGEYCGLLTAEAIAKWGIRGNAKDRSVRNVLGETGKNRVAFVSRTMGVKKVLNAYQENLMKGTPLLAVIITEHGKRSENPAGIITVADLPRIYDDII